MSNLAKGANGSKRFDFVGRLGKSFLSLSPKGTNGGELYFTIGAGGSLSLSLSLSDTPKFSDGDIKAMEEQIREDFYFLLNERRA